jgi:hypothetical protein
VANVTQVALLVIAKEPVPGRAKTRLTPPCTPLQASTLAAAALTDTIEVVAQIPAVRRVLVFEGDARRFVQDGFELVRQRGEGLGQRLAAAFEDVGAPALLIGMDTPQLTCRVLQDAVRALDQPGVDAVLGPAQDGGYWSIGFSSPTPGAFADVPMSRECTLSRQRARLAQLGLRVREQVRLRDVDTIEDARAVADEAPDTLFAKALAGI